MKGVILSGGKGMRMRPFTYTAAKQLVPVANKPILFYALEDMQRFGVREVAIIVGETEDQIRAAVGNGEKWNLEVTYIRQDQPRGLSHAVGCAREFVGQDKFVVILGDNFVQEDLTPVVKRFEEDDSLYGTLFVVTVPDARPFGVVEVESDRVVSHIEKPKNPTSNLIGIGYYLFHWHAFEIFDQDKQQWLVPSARGEYEITLFTTYLVENGFKVGYHVVSGPWVDTGKMEDMLEANRVVLSRVTGQIDGSLDSKCSIAGPVIVGTGTRISNTTIVGPVIIGANCDISDCYIGPFTSVYDHAKLQDCEIENSMLFEHVTIESVQTRIERSMIGRYASLIRRDKRPSTIQVQLGDHSQVELP